MNTAASVTGIEIKMSASEFTQRARGCLLGLAVGDAIGTTVEFQSRGSFAPVTEVVGGGPFDLKPGEWTDDTSMALCLAESLAECGGFDARDQIERYCRWWRNGHMSSNGRCFDIGITVSAALRKFEESGDPFSGSTAADTAGNGSIMRLAPVPIFANGDISETIRLSRESSRTTHGAQECLDACHALGVLLHHLLGGMQKEEALDGFRQFYAPSGNQPARRPHTGPSRSGNKHGQECIFGNARGRQRNETIRSVANV